LLQDDLRHHTACKSTTDAAVQSQGQCESENNFFGHGLSLQDCEKMWNVLPPTIISEKRYLSIKTPLKSGVFWRY
jgi:hypothetical protein